MRHRITDSSAKTRRTGGRCEFLTRTLSPMRAPANRTRLMSSRAAAPTRRSHGLLRPAGISARETRSKSRHAPTRSLTWRWYGVLRRLQEPPPPSERYRRVRRTPLQGACWPGQLDLGHPRLSVACQGDEFDPAVRMVAMGATDEARRSENQGPVEIMASCDSGEDARRLDRSFCAEYTPPPTNTLCGTALIVWC
jgi:hypothetical protein